MEKGEERKKRGRKKKGGGEKKEGEKKKRGEKKRGGEKKKRGRKKKGGKKKEGEKKKEEERRKRGGEEKEGEKKKRGTRKRRREEKGGEKKKGGGRKRGRKKKLKAFAKLEHCIARACSESLFSSFVPRSDVAIYAAQGMDFIPNAPWLVRGHSWSSPEVGGMAASSAVAFLEQRLVATSLRNGGGSAAQPPGPALQSALDALGETESAKARGFQAALKGAQRSAKERPLAIQANSRSWTPRWVAWPSFKKRWPSQFQWSQRCQVPHSKSRSRSWSRRSSG